MCSEALKPCKNGAQCFSDADRCDNVSKCDDGTDEEGCFLGQDVLDTSTKAQRTDPIISIECYESTRFSTTTITTTTTTTTTITPHEETNKDEDILTTLKKPYVIAGMVVGALVLITVTAGLVLAVRRKQKNSDSEDIINDMWISGKDSGKELEPLNM
ncbi:uncharacterized protein LOC132745029 [Ruditapes philippinarum]|uniref:uncharacterized protein LOC132745029 n=1 Tax=Ruditapes philippinarum TaxID=129788 RepID=UPI00295C1546|nr:uncharacterized protein LOC132745029 [Ruditapes philippinarum]